MSLLPSHNGHNRVTNEQAPQDQKILQLMGHTGVRPSRYLCFAVQTRVPGAHVSQHFSGQDPELRCLDLAPGYNSHQPTGKLVASLNLLTAVIEFDFFPAFRIHVLAAARAKLPSRAYPEY
jgi:hypothetical protein